jgi:Zn-dependent protease
LPFSRVGLNLSALTLPDINAAQIFISFIVLLFSLTVHETAHAWTADRLGDPTARQLGRVSMNPLVHADPIGTILFPLLASISRLPLIGWAKPVPVVISRLRRQRRDYVLVAAAGPASNLVLAAIAALALRITPVSPATLRTLNVSAPLASIAGRALEVNLLLAIFNMIPIPPLDGGNVLGGLLPRAIGRSYDRLVRPYGFLLIYVLMLTGGLSYLVTPPYLFLLSWLL